VRNLDSRTLNVFKSGGALPKNDNFRLAVEPESVEGEGFLLTPALAISYVQVYRVWFH
jgi:hypothetical protein